MPRIVACGTREDVYDDFKTAHRKSSDNLLPMLLVDAEGPVAAAESWRHLEDQAGWKRPANATNDEQCHLMVQAMESWFLADKKALGKFYGQGFQESALPANPQIEDISKEDVRSGLNQATRQTTKGPYNKGSHSFDILAKLDPAKVQEASPHAKRFIETLMKSK